MAALDTTYDKDPKHHENSTGSSLCKELTFEESSVLSDKLLCDDVCMPTALTELTADKLQDEKSQYDNVDNSMEMQIDKPRDDKSLYDDAKLTVIVENLREEISEVAVNGLHDEKSPCENVDKSTEVMAENLHEKLFTDGVQSAELIGDKLSGFEANTLPADSPAIATPASFYESQYHSSHNSVDCHCCRSQFQWQSTPLTYCSDKPLALPAVSGRPTQSYACDSVISGSQSVVGAGQSDLEEKVTNQCRPLHCVASSTDNADPDCGIADDVLLNCDRDMSKPSLSVVDDAVVGCNKDTTPDCEVADNNDDIVQMTDESFPRIELQTAAAASRIEAVAPVNSDEVADCVSSVDIKDDHDHQTTEAVCLELSEMMQECCLVDDSRVLNSTASDADISDSFDLDVAAKDLECAVSAGMLDFLLESYEDSDEDVSSEGLCECLDEWSPVSLSDDDSSESTLADSSDDSVVEVVDDVESDESNDSVVKVVYVESDDDEDVSRRHERIRRRLLNTENDHFVDRSEANDDPVTVCVNSSRDDFEDDEDVSRRHDRIKRRMNKTDNNDSNVDLNATNCDMITSTCDDDDKNSDDGAVDDDAVVKPHGRVDECVATSDSGHYTVDADIICLSSVNEADGDDDVLMRHERVKQILKYAAYAAVAYENGRVMDSDQANADFSSSCTGDGNVSSQCGKYLKNAASASDDDDDDDDDDDYDKDDGDDDEGGTKDEGTTDVNSRDDVQTKDQVSSSEICVLMSTTEQSPQHKNDKNASTAVDECNCHNVQDTQTSVTADMCEAVPSACPRILSPQQPPDIQNIDTGCNKLELAGETSLSLDELVAGSTSTPSTCSQHSQRCSVIDWQEGVHNGVCRHSDGSEIRT